MDAKVFSLPEMPRQGLGFVLFAFPESEWKSIRSPKKQMAGLDVFSCCFPCCLFSARQEDVAADWLARLHAVSCQIFQTKEV